MREGISPVAYVMIRSPFFGDIERPASARSLHPMGEELTTVVERADAPVSEQLTEVIESDVASADAPVGPPKKRLRTLIIGLVVAALVITGGTIGGIAWASQVAHDEAVLAAETAHATADLAVTGNGVALVELRDAVSAALTARDSAGSQVLAHAALLGGTDALAPLTEAHAALVLALNELFGVDAPTIESELPDAAELPRPEAVDPTLSTEELTALARSLTAQARTTDAATASLRERAASLSATTTAVSDAVAGVAAGLPTAHAALLAGNGLATAEAKAASDAALAALAEATDGADLGALLETYATAASGVTASHASETARIAAEEAARQAAQKRSGGGGGGKTSEGGSSYGSGVLGETNRNRAANGLGLLVNNETLISAACSWAQSLAASDSGLSHSSNPGGFSWWGENVAYGYNSASSVVAGWMASPGHKANILKSQYTKMGSCSAVAASGTKYWVQQFGA